ncbi:MULTISPECIES: hypothetical protein [unclassified Paenibacillus]|uniref:hypothetical protein n=1 Tax=unclassified Paenibacillus TaxID=185978 RepID=UPI000FE20F0B|nr:MULTISPECIES: hypothetical protein [unclassified Paenibacillus]MCM3172297.1 hypothetical protein [Paenibacillus sp. MER 99-2]
MKKIAKKSVLILLALFMLQISLVSAASAKNSLTAGESLTQGQSLTSNDGRFTLIMQTDGNLVLYKQGKSLWSTKTSGAKYQWRDHTGHTITRYPQVLKVENNLLRLTDYNDSHWFWFSKIQEWTNAHYQGNVPPGLNGDTLVVQDDGNVVFYSTGKGPVWATNTGGH